MVNTTLCYIEKGECYLMLYRNKKVNDPNAGKWVGIGGKFEPGETPEECLLREIREETGIIPVNFTFKGIIEFRNDAYEDEDMYLFKAQMTETGSLTDGTRSTGDASPTDKGTQAENALPADDTSSADKDTSEDHAQNICLKYLLPGTKEPVYGFKTGIDCPEGETAWVRKCDILKLKLWAGDRCFLEPLIAGREHISMRLTYSKDMLVECKYL